MSFADPSPRYFPSRDERTVLDFVFDDFPYPLALTYHRLQQEMDRQEPIAAAWQLRDAFEVLIRFSATLAIADALASPTDGVVIGDLAGTLLTPQGLSMGHWHRLLEASLDPLKPFVKEGKLDGSGRVLPDLFSAFYRETGRMQRTDVNRSISGDAESFIPWRNRVFGHGVFSEDRSWYATETNRMLEPLHAFYTALKPTFEAWQLVSQNSDGSITAWSGCGSPELAPRHDHEPKGDPLPMALVSRQARYDCHLPLSPLLSIHQCAICGEPSVFFFDRQNKAKTILLEYARGHHHARPQWADIARLQSLVPPTYSWERGSYDSHEIIATDEIVFRDFENTFHRPAYLLDRIWGIIDERSRGYTHIIGPAGTGKTYLIRGLEAEATRHDAVVLPYFIRSGALTDARTFLNELHLLASNHQQLRARTDAPQQLVTSVAELQDQFVAYLEALMDANRLETLVLAIDAIDELPEPEPGAVSIAALLPAPSQLPDGCTIVLTSRETYRPGIRREVDRLAGISGDGYDLIDVSPESEDNTAVTRAWLAATLPANLRSEATIGFIVAKSNGVFLYASHLAQALTSGAFDNVETMPDAEDFYPAYLARIRERVGDETFETAYLQPLLLLVAARQGVTKDQLIAWGVPADRLETALYDLHDFLHQQRIPGFHETLSHNPAPRYWLAHEDFARFAQSDPRLSKILRNFHASIARRSINMHGENWSYLDPSNDDDMYELGQFLHHAKQGDVEIPLSTLMAYAQQCNVAGYSVLALGQTRLARDMFLAAHQALEPMVDLLTAIEFRDTQATIQHEVTKAYAGLGIASSEMGRLLEALPVLERAVTTMRAGGMAYSREFLETLRHYGDTLAGLGSVTESLTIFEECVQIGRQIASSDALDDHALLATVLSSRGASFQDLGRSYAAMSDYVEAKSLLEQFACIDKLSIIFDWVQILERIGTLSTPEEALEYCDMAEAILVCRSYHQRTKPKLASIESNRFFAFTRAGQLQEANAAAQRAAIIYHNLVEEGQLEYEGDMYISRSQFDSYRAVPLPELETILDKLIDRYEHLTVSGDFEQSVKLAGAIREVSVHFLINSAFSEGHRTRVLASLQTAQDILTNLPQEIPMVAYRLSQIYDMRAHMLFDACRTDDALDNWEVASDLIWPHVDSGQDNLLDQLTMYLNMRAGRLLHLKRYAQCVDCHQQIKNILARSVDNGNSSSFSRLLFALNSFVQVLVGIRAIPEISSVMQDFVTYASQPLEKSQTSLVQGQTESLLSTISKLPQADLDVLVLSIDEPARNFLIWATQGAAA